MNALALSSSSRSGMGALAQRQQQRRAPASTTRVGRRTAVSVKAWAGDNAPWAALLRFFTPRKQLDVKDDVWPENNFKGTIPSRDRKPFKDGFMGQKLPSQPTATTAEEAPAGEGPIEYLNQAAERVVKHNFKGEDSEPQWGKLGAGGRGWSGEVHGERGHDDKGGFHAKIK